MKTPSKAELDAIFKTNPSRALRKKGHGERDHSKYSASGSERWFNCPGSVELSEGIPDKPNKYSEEGTKAHELLEEMLKAAIAIGAHKLVGVKAGSGYPKEMVRHCANAANFILGQWKKTPGAEIEVETRIYLDWIDPEMFGTYDSSLIEHFGTLHVFDFKYGKKIVSPIKNLQMIFYALGLAKKHDWNFNDVRVWIIQPRAQGYQGPTFWDIPMDVLKSFWQAKFADAVAQVRAAPKEFKEGSWCHWCKAKKVCPLKTQSFAERTRELFLNAPPMSGREPSREKGKHAKAKT